MPMIVSVFMWSDVNQFIGDCLLSLDSFAICCAYWHCLPLLPFSVSFTRFTSTCRRLFACHCTLLLYCLMRLSSLLRFAFTVLIAMCQSLALCHHNILALYDHTHTAPRCFIFNCRWLLFSLCRAISTRWSLRDRIAALSFKSWNNKKKFWALFSTCGMDVRRFHGGELPVCGHIPIPISSLQLTKRAIYCHLFCCSFLRAVLQCHSCSSLAIMAVQLCPFTPAVRFGVFTTPIPTKNSLKSECLCRLAPIVMCSSLFLLQISIILCFI